MEEKFNLYSGNLDQEYKELKELEKEKKLTLFFKIINILGLIIIFILSGSFIYTLFSDFFSKYNSNEIFILQLFGFFFFLIIITLSINNLFSFSYKFNSKIEKLKKITFWKKKSRENYRKEIKPLENIIQGLKYKINIKNIEDNEFKKTIKLIKEKLENKVLKFLNKKVKNNEKINAYIYTIFNETLNGGNNKDILKEIKNEKKLLNLLFYILDLLKNINDVSVGWSNIKKEELEKFFLKLKSDIEERYKELKKEEDNKF